MTSQVDPEGVDFCQLQGMATWARTLAERHLEAYARFATLLDGVMQACLELAQIGYRVAADREVTLEEEELLAPAFTKLRIAINHYEACVLRRPVAVDRRSA